MIVKTENGLILGDFRIIKIEAFKTAGELPSETENPYIGKFVLNGYIDKDTKLMLRAFETIEDAMNTLNAIYCAIPGGVSLAPQDYIAQNASQPKPTVDYEPNAIVRTFQNGLNAGLFKGKEKK